MTNTNLASVQSVLIIRPRPKLQLQGTGKRNIFPMTEADISLNIYIITELRRVVFMTNKIEENNLDTFWIIVLFKLDSTRTCYFQTDEASCTAASIRARQRAQNDPCRANLASSDPPLKIVTTARSPSPPCPWACPDVPTWPPPPHPSTDL